MTQFPGNTNAMAGSVDPHRPPNDSEEVYYEGSPSLKGEAGTLAICFLIAIALIGGGIAVAVFTGGLGFLAILVGFVLGALVMAGPVVAAKVTRYKITNYRIDYEHGLLNKTIETLELWHVEDIKFHQSLVGRVMGVGTLTIVSDDKTTPRLTMQGLPDPRRLFDLLKQRVISVKRSRGVIKMDI